MSTDPTTTTTSPADPPILPYSAVAILPVAAMVWLSIDLPHALGSVVGSAVVLFNLWLLSVLGPRLVASLAGDRSPVMWLLALFAKFVLLIAVFFSLFRVLPPYGLLLGFVPMLVGTLAAGVRMALAESASEAVSRSAAKES